MTIVERLQAAAVGATALRCGHDAFNEYWTHLQNEARDDPDKRGPGITQIDGISIIYDGSLGPDEIEHGPPVVRDMI